MREQPGPTTPGRFVWHELVTQDPAKAQAFYTALFGWSFDTGDSSYVHILCGDTHIGGIVKATVPHIPSHWLPYISVTDVDASQKLAASTGCSVIVGPMDVPETGRFVVMHDTQGALFSLWHGAHGDPPEDVPAPVGAFCWDRLETGDPDAAFAAYEKIFGWARTPVPGVTGVDELMRGSRPAASMAKSTSGAPAHWLSYVRVASLGATSARTRELGGKVLVDRIDIPGKGALAVLQDTQGAVIAAYEKAS